MLPTAFDIKYVFNRYTLGDAFCKDKLGLSEAQIADPALDLLKALGFSRDADRGGQHLLLRRHDGRGRAASQDEHLAVFDCANPCGRIGKRFLSVDEPHPDDGGGPAVHLRARSPRPSTCRPGPR